MYVLWNYMHTTAVELHGAGNFTHGYLSKKRRKSVADSKEQQQQQQQQSQAAADGQQTSLAASSAQDTQAAVEPGILDDQQQVLNGDHVQPTVEQPSEHPPVIDWDNVDPNTLRYGGSVDLTMHQIAHSLSEAARLPDDVAQDAQQPQLLAVAAAVLRYREALYRRTSLNKEGEFSAVVRKALEQAGLIPVQPEPEDGLDDNNITPVESEHGETDVSDEVSDEAPDEQIKQEEQQHQQQQEQEQEEKKRQPKRRRQKQQQQEQQQEATDNKPKRRGRPKKHDAAAKQALSALAAKTDAALTGSKRKRIKREDDDDDNEREWAVAEDRQEEGRDQIPVRSSSSGSSSVEDASDDEQDEGNEQSMQPTTAASAADAQGHKKRVKTEPGQESYKFTPRNRNKEMGLPAAPQNRPQEQIQVLVKDYADRIASREQFNADLQRWYGERNWSVAHPVIGSHSWDMYDIFKLVAKRGGFEAVCARRLWKTVAMEWRPDLENYKGVNAHMKDNYKKTLLAFENYFTAKVHAPVRKMMFSVELQRGKPIVRSKDHPGRPPRVLKRESSGSGALVNPAGRGGDDGDDRSLKRSQVKEEPHTRDGRRPKQHEVAPGMWQGTLFVDCPSKGWVLPLFKPL